MRTPRGAPSAGPGPPEHSKTQQAGPSATSTPDNPILGIAGQPMTAWLTASGLSEGAVFRRLWTMRIGDARSPAAVGAIVQRRAAQAGLKGSFGGHSLRSGFITEGARQGVALPALMAMTEHRSVASVIGYFQAGGVTDNPAARLLEGSAEVKPASTSRYAIRATTDLLTRRTWCDRLLAYSGQLAPRGFG